MEDLGAIFSGVANPCTVDGILQELLSGGRFALANSFTVLFQGISWIASNRIFDILYLVQRIKSAATAVDVDGNTLLLSVLKSWSGDTDEMKLQVFVAEMLNHGAEIHMRDRVGDSMLTIACRRGFRLAAKTLLLRGANVHV